MTAAAPKKRGRPRGSKNKPKIKPPVETSGYVHVEGVPAPATWEITASEANCGPNEGILDPIWQEYHASDKAYPLQEKDLQWAWDNLKAIGQSVWRDHIVDTAGNVVHACIQRLWKKKERPPSLDEIALETAMSFAQIEDVVNDLVEEERLIRVGEVLIPVNVARKEPEPEPVIDGEMVLEEVASPQDGDSAI